jgi:uncharacterized membrane protein YphA (DoxX/SURF4 family)
MTVVSRLWAILLGLLLLSAGLSKIGSPLRMLADIYAYQIPLPDWLANAAAYSLPWIEILLGALLIFGYWRVAVTSATLLLLAIYTFLTAQSWWRGLPIECGCLDLSGIHPALAFLETPAGSTVRNLLLLLTTAAMGIFQKNHPTPKGLNP